MIHDAADFDQVFDACRAAVRGPLSTFVDAPYSVREHAQRVRASINSIATSVRRWAIHRGDVHYVLLGAAGRKFTLSVLIEQATINCVNAATDELQKAIAGLDISEVSVCILGLRHADSSLFDASGRYEIYRRERNAAAA